jgi:hypothetical protein
MGMLFNTPDTLTLVRLSNITFHRAGFNGIKTTPPSNHFLQDLQSLGGASVANGIFAKLCTPLNIDDANITARWQFWLRLLDTKQQTYQGTQDYLSGWIGKGIHTALTQNRHTAVEFFAVPAAGQQVSLDLPFTDYPDTEHQHLSTMIVKVNTDVVDNFNNHPLRRRHP